MVNFAQIFFALQAALFLITFAAYWVATRVSVFVDYGFFFILLFLFVLYQAYYAKSYGSKLFWLVGVAVSAGVTIPVVDPIIDWTNFLFVGSVACFIATAMRYFKVSIRDDSIILFLVVLLVIGVFVLGLSESRNSTLELTIALFTCILLSSVLGIEISVYDIVPSREERIDSAMYVLLALFASVVASASAVRLIVS